MTDCTQEYAGTPVYTEWSGWETLGSYTQYATGVCSGPVQEFPANTTIAAGFSTVPYSSFAVSLYHTDWNTTCNQQVTITGTVQANGSIPTPWGPFGSFGAQVGLSIAVQFHLCSDSNDGDNYDDMAVCSGAAMNCYVTCPAGTVWDSGSNACVSQGGGDNGDEQQCINEGCTWDSDGCNCQNSDPIIVDTDGLGFHLTNTQQGVPFDFWADGRPIQIAWTAAGSTNAFLAIDLNGNGRIDNGKELFGNLSPQSPSAHSNGFAALAEYDKPQNGGNGDGVIDHSDAVYSRLRLWIDRNHNGISEPDELYSLPDLGITGFSLDYYRAQFKDPEGNQFLFRSRVQDSAGGKYAYDVVLASRHN